MLGEISAWVRHNALKAVMRVEEQRMDRPGSSA